MDEAQYQNLIAEIRTYQKAGEVAEYFIDQGRKQIELRAVGNGGWIQKLRNVPPDVRVVPRESAAQAYYFLSSEVRPGSGIVRVYGGKPQGPGGTLTCFLSSKDGRDKYFVTAGHVVSNFWAEEDVRNSKGNKHQVASIYRYQKGFPATNSTRFLGKLEYLSDRPQPINFPGREGSGLASRGKPDLDIGIVALPAGVHLVQRTTCYGTFGEEKDTKDAYEKIETGQAVMKCGAEETHHTFAVVENTSETVTVFGPDGLLYELKRQVTLRSESKPLPSDCTNPPKDWSAQKHKRENIPFGVAGDSGTMVVDRESKRPVGMLIAGSVLDGRYVMTPFHAIAEFWRRERLVLLRA